MLLSVKKLQEVGLLLKRSGHFINIVRYLSSAHSLTSYLPLAPSHSLTS
jgi:hypothetical protein